MAEADGLGVGMAGNGCSRVTVVAVAMAAVLLTFYHSSVPLRIHVPPFFTSVAHQLTIFLSSLPP